MEHFLIFLNIVHFLLLKVTTLFSERFRVLSLESNHTIFNLNKSQSYIVKSVFLGAKIAKSSENSLIPYKAIVSFFFSKDITIRVNKRMNAYL